MAVVVAEAADLNLGLALLEVETAVLGEEIAVNWADFRGPLTDQKNGSSCLRI